MSEPHHLLTVDEVRAALNPIIPLSAVYDAISSGRLPATKFGRRWFVSREALDRFICHNSESPPASTSESEPTAGSSRTPAESTPRARLDAALERLQKRP